MRTLRAKLLAIVGAAAVAFVIISVTGAVMSTRVQEELDRIQDVHLPRLELGPRLERQAEAVSRGLQDAVAASDLEQLLETRKLRDRFIAEVDGAQALLAPTLREGLGDAMTDFHATATEVSKRLIADEPGPELADAVVAMQAKQRRVTDLVEDVIELDRADLARAFAATTRQQQIAAQVRLTVSVACLLLVVGLAIWLGQGVLRSLNVLADGFERFGAGEFGQRIPIVGRDELGDVARRANDMAASLERLSAERTEADWLKAGHVALMEDLRGELSPVEAATRAVSSIARTLAAPVGALYYAGADGSLELWGQHARSGGDGDASPALRFRPGEGLVGEAALRQTVTVIKPPEGYLRVRSGLGEAPPQALVLVPLPHGGEVKGVLELALFEPWSERSHLLLLSVRETLAIALEVASARASTIALLAETRRQADRLSAQEEELRASNAELETQQEELRQTNEELVQQTEELEGQRRLLEERNVALDEARAGLERKADELATVSAYKSQFLTNMSHELRTPLNSMLLLSSLLADNQGQNLTVKQVEYCTTIHGAGKDLLGLINQVLDLAKVEAGKQDVTLAPTELERFVDHATRTFGPVASHKGLELTTSIARDVPASIITDGARVEQILTNLIGNALKFTDRGTITLSIGRPSPEVAGAVQRPIAFAVTDTGPGIAPEHQGRVFAPFEQVSGQSDRRHGGTGLGLSIARELATLLGGHLQLHSVPGAGSTFTLVLPEEPVAAAARAPAPSPAPAGQPGAVSEPYILVIEDDPASGDAFREVIHAHGFECVVAPDGASGLRQARARQPLGIVLDVRLPDIDGFAVMKQLHEDPATARIPVHFASAVDGAERGMALGAVGYLTKPATRRDLVNVIGSLVQKSSMSLRLLVVEDDLVVGESLMRQLALEGLDARRVTSAGAALDAMALDHFGCLIVDLSLPDMDGLDLLARIQERSGDRMPSVVVYTARALSKAETTRLEAYTDAIVLKEGPSTDRLLNEVRLFVRRLKGGVAGRRPVVSAPLPTSVRLEGKRILIVDDDMRTVYALSATLRAKGVVVHVADTGRVGLDVLNEHPEMDAVLMDIMMPEMDGYEAMRRIRRDGRFGDLLIVALTAKAMKGDEEACRIAGASDYVPKPVDADQLLALLHARLSGSPGAAG